MGGRRKEKAEPGEDANANALNWTGSEAVQDRD